VELFRAFRLVAAPHTVTKGFVIFQTDRNIIFKYLVMLEKTLTDTSVCV